jgi:hypothetical protein
VGAAALSAAGVVLVEAVVHSAALRGHWSWCPALSIVVKRDGTAALSFLSFEVPRADCGEAA